MGSESSDRPDEEFHRDRREHGGMPKKLDDDRLAHETEDERVAAGLDAFNPDDVPSATETAPLDTDIRDTEEWQEERAKVRRQEDKDELIVEGERADFPPTRYEE
jgi:hypothetical protein